MNSKYHILGRISTCTFAPPWGAGNTRCQLHLHKYLPSTYPPGRKDVVFIQQSRVPKQAFWHFYIHLVILKTRHLGVGMMWSQAHGPIHLDLSGAAPVERLIICYSFYSYRIPKSWLFAHMFSYLPWASRIHSPNYSSFTHLLGDHCPDLKESMVPWAEARVG